MIDNGEEQDQDLKAWNELHPIYQDRLRRSVALLAEAHGRKPSLGVQNLWCRSLAKYAKGSRIWGAFKAASQEERMPSIAGFCRLLAPRPELQTFTMPPPLTEAEQKRSDQAAIMSMLWLVYTKGWKPSDFSGDVFKRVFNRMDADADTCLNGAKEAFDERTVRAWMAQQEAQGN